VINPVCLCVCLSVHEHISGIAEPIGTKFCVQIPCGRGSVLLQRRCTTLCTSGCIDDVTFRARCQKMAADHEWRGDTGAKSDVYEFLFLYSSSISSRFLTCIFTCCPVSILICLTSNLSTVRNFSLRSYHAIIASFSYHE